MILRPFFRFFGAKWRSTARGLYPHPTRDTIIEPFAGSAGYSLHHPERRVILIERDATIAGIWRFLIGASEDDIMRIPLVDDVGDLPPWLDYGARALVGFSMNAATTSPRRTLSSSARRLREQGRKFYGWTADLRDRVASQVGAIKHWTLIEGDYFEAPNLDATWFVDSPYEQMGGALPARLARYRLRRASALVPFASGPAHRLRGARRGLAAVPRHRRGEVGAAVAHRARGAMAMTSLYLPASTPLELWWGP